MNTLMQQMASTAASVEIAWTAIALSGIAFSLIFLRIIYESIETIERWILERRAVRWGPRHRFAVIFFVSVALLTLVWFGFVLLGLDALFNPPAMTPEGREVSMRAGWLLVGMESGLLLFEGLLLYSWVSARSYPVRKKQPLIRARAHVQVPASARPLPPTEDA